MRAKSARLTLACAMTTALALLAVEARAAEAPAFYLACDGYGPPTDTGDGMNRPAISNVIFGPGGSDRIERGEPGVGAAGVAACDAAVAVLPAKYWMRQVSLLRARAMHELEKSDPKDALLDLDLADQIGAQFADLWYARSVGFGVAAVRARALRESGDPAKALAVIQEAIALRPYDSRASGVALLALGLDADQATTYRLIQNAARLDPRVIGMLKWPPGGTIRDLWRMLPEPETAGRQSPYKEALLPMKLFSGARHGQFGQGREGYSDFPPDAAGVVVVRYHAVRTGTADTAAEMALLRAAELAGQAGKGGLIIVGRDEGGLFPRVLETELDVLFVDPAAPPPAYAATPWRIIDAADVRAKLAPIYADSAGIKLQ